MKLIWCRTDVLVHGIAMVLITISLLQMSYFIKLLCCYILAGTSQEQKVKRRRKLELDDSTETKSENDLWNDVHMQLVRDLEKKGLLWRYGIKHLKLWTDLIIEGRVSGLGEEPIWDQYLEQVIVPPKRRRSSSPSSSSTSSLNDSSSNKNLMEMLILQNQQRMEAESRRTEIFQTTLLTMMSSNFSFMNQVIA